MKLNKKILQEIIREVLEETQQVADTDIPLDARTKKVDSATQTGALMDVEQYTTMLKRVLLSPKVSPQVRKQGLEALFGPKGPSINSLVLQMLKGAQE